MHSNATFDCIHYFCKWHLVILSNTWIWGHTSKNITVGWKPLKGIVLVYNIQGSKNLHFPLLFFSCEYDIFTATVPSFSTKNLSWILLLLTLITTSRCLEVTSCHIWHHWKYSRQHHILYTLLGKCYCLLLIGMVYYLSIFVGTLFSQFFNLDVIF